MTAFAERGSGGPAPVRRALWYLEAHLSDDVTLDDVAAVAAVSRFRLARGFLAVTGMPVMGYLRRRRLSEAARRLAGGAPDILDVALQWGYGSHEAFTRAFRGQFGVTPEQVRNGGSTTTLELMEPLDVDQPQPILLDPPRIVDAGPMRLAGLGERYTFDGLHGIPALWHRFVPRLAAVAHRVGTDTYGVCCGDDGDADLHYVASVQVGSFDGLPADFVRLSLAAQRYAVFLHRGHISDIRTTTHAVWTCGLPEAGLEPVDAPDFERYTAAFDPDSGYGEVEIWVAVAR